MIPAIMVAASEHRTMALNLGALDFLAKPSSAEQLKQVLNAIETNDRTVPANIIVLDDETEVGYMLNTLLASAEFQFTMKFDPTDALEAVIASPPDVLVIDLMMPTMNGFEFLSRVRAYAHLQDLPVIVFSSQVLSAEESRFLSLHAQAVVPKGSLANLRALLTELRRVCKRSPSAAPEG
jgi:CheY-like chemotaxis protein